MNLTRRLARRLPWCLILDDGLVHVAHWFDIGPGPAGLIVFTEDDQETTVCHGGVDLDLNQLAARGVLWRDRASIGRPVCPHCEDQIERDDEALLLVLDQ